MSENNHTPQRRQRRHSSQAGSFLIEFGLLFLFFLLFMFCVMEAARAMYLWNTLQEVTRRAASVAVNTDFSNAAAKNQVRRYAIFRNLPGTLVLGNPVTDAHIHIDYLYLERAADGKLTPEAILTGALPSSPARNQIACIANANSPSCIRFVRVRICAPSSDPDACDTVPYVPLFPLIKVPASFTLPLSTTIARAETLGYAPGQPLDP